MAIPDADRAELKALAASAELREDARHIAATRHNPFLVDGEVDGDRVLEFLDQYNAFMNHPVKPATPFIETNMKL